MGTPYLGEIRIVSFNYPPNGWAFCNGQTLAISQNQALFSLLGTTYGGNGTTTFQLPNLQGRVPFHFGTSVFGGNFVIGQTGGEVTHTLIPSEMPAHTHLTAVHSTAADQGGPLNTSILPNTKNYWGNGSQPAYAATSNATMNPANITYAGGSQPHENRPPFLVLNFVIALVGIFPSRS
jgi:microcystin-dependent protein